MAIAHEIIGWIVLGTALPRLSRFSRARRWFDAGSSWLERPGQKRAERKFAERKFAERKFAERKLPERDCAGEEGDPSFQPQRRTGAGSPPPFGRTRFRLRVALARCAYGMGDYLAWRRECGHARELDPQRFARLPHPFSLFDVVQPHLGVWPGSVAGGGIGAGNDTPRGGLVLGRPGLGTPEEVGVIPPRGRNDAGPAGGSSAIGCGDGQVPTEDAEWLEQVLREFDRVLDPEGPGANPGSRATDGSRQPDGTGAGRDDCQDEGERRRFDALGPVEPEEILRADLDSLARRLQASDPAP